MKRKLVYDESDVEIKRKCTDENASEYENSSTNYEPVHFLRCHSRMNDAADVQTQIWHCAFEPHSSSPKLLASCGGNSVCFIDVRTGKVEGKYYSDKGDVFYSLCWTTVTDLKNEENIVAVGGACKDIHLLHPNEGIVFFKYQILKNRKESVCSLLFHPFEKNLLFCAESNGTMSIFDIGSPLPPYYKTKFCKLLALSAESEIFSLAFCSTSNILLAACNDGLHGWKIKEVDEGKKMADTTLIKFKHPESPNVKYGGGQLVDSVAVLGKGVVASKCALHGNIYVWNLKETLQENADKSSCIIAPSHVLKWKDTDNYFMNIGYNEVSGILACGDDKGALWIYHTHSFLSGSSKKKQKGVSPAIVLPWPEVEDVHLEKKRKLRLDVYDIVVDKVCVDNSGQYIVAVTSNNMVCVWKRLGK